MRHYNFLKLNFLYKKLKHKKLINKKNDFIYSSDILIINELEVKL